MAILVCRNLRLGRESAKQSARLRDLQTRLAHSQNLASLGQLLGGIAHEITNPLGIILGFAQSSLRNLKEEDPSREALRSIEREALRCKEILHNTLLLSRMDGAPRQKVHLGRVVESALAVIAPQAGIRRIRVHQQVEEDLGEVWASPVQVQQILINLCNNALDAMPQGGVLDVRVRRVSREGRECAQLIVTDSGGGIPQDVLPRIFDPFFTTKSAGKGTGLGLALVHQIVKQYAGTVEVSSGNGGTQFRILLPYEGLRIPKEAGSAAG